MLTAINGVAAGAGFGLALLGDISIAMTTARFRPAFIALGASPEHCTWCPENFVAGLEMYGGLGDTERFGLTDTSHYLAPVIAWNLPTGLAIRLSPGVGLNDDSHRFLFRFGVSYEFSHVGRR